MTNLQFIEVSLAGKKVGKMGMTAEGQCAFEYDAGYLHSGISISPFYLPLKAGVFIAKRDPFRGNFGVFDDSLPDGWGNLLLDRYLTEQGINPHGLSVLQRLSLMGAKGRGALEYYPDSSTPNNNDGLVDFDKLAKDAEKLLNANYTGDSLDVLYKYGGSSGGARPKIFITIEGEEWLVKFRSSTDPANTGKIEYKHSLLAKQCGIEMPETKLFEGKYFGVKRFDRVGGSKQHVISAAGLLNADYRIPSLDYTILLTACLKLTHDIEDVYKLYRLMVFNILIKNRDDHAKNFSFILRDNQWQLSPAYDLLPSTGFNGYHTTTVNGKGNPDLKDILAVAETLGLDKKRVVNIYDELKSKVNGQ